jgi:hypothetical protein
MSATELVFLATVVGVGIAVGRGATQEGRGRPFGLGAWLALTGALAHSGWVGQFDARPPHLVVLMAATFIGTVALAFSRPGTRAVEGVAWSGLIGFQVFRVPVEWVLFQLHREGVVPVQMTFEGRNLDIVSGASAPLVAWLAATGRIGRRGILLWNCAALALLANIVTIALLSTPTPLRVFPNEPANTFVARLPWIWLPTFLVPAALLGHLLTFRKLARMR